MRLARAPRLPLYTRGPYKAEAAWVTASDRPWRKPFTSSTAPISICSASASQRSMAARHCGTWRNFVVRPPRATSSKSNFASRTTKARSWTQFTRLPRRKPRHRHQPGRLYAHLGRDPRRGRGDRRAGGGSAHQQHIRARELSTSFPYRRGGKGEPVRLRRRRLCACHRRVGRADRRAPQELGA